MEPCAPAATPQSSSSEACAVGKWRFISRLRPGGQPGGKGRATIVCVAPPRRFNFQRPTPNAQRPMPEAAALSTSRPALPLPWELGVRSWALGVCAAGILRGSTDATLPSCVGCASRGRKAAQPCATPAATASKPHSHRRPAPRPPEASPTATRARWPARVIQPCGHRNPVAHPPHSAPRPPASGRPAPGRRPTATVSGWCRPGLQPRAHRSPAPRPPASRRRATTPSRAATGNAIRSHGSSSSHHPLTARV